MKKAMFQIKSPTFLTSAGSCAIEPQMSNKIGGRMNLKILSC